MLREGDLVRLDFDPVRGNEQGGERPALVLTSASFHATRNTAIVCPITRNLAPWPTKVVLPEGLPITGAVLVEQLRLISRAERGLAQIGRVPFETLQAVRRVLAVLLQISANPAEDELQF
jgi:mRNA interferase MazF